jgi:hypothetical protein
MKPVTKFPLIALAVIAMFLPMAGFAQIPEYYNWLSTAEGIQHPNRSSWLFCLKVWPSHDLTTVAMA